MHAALAPASLLILHAASSMPRPQVIAFATQNPDPFSPDFPYANPWYPKKDNKGKKDAPKMQKI